MTAIQKLTDDGINGQFDEVLPGVFAEVVSQRSLPNSTNLSGHSRQSSIITLFDGKTLNAENSLKWDTKGTGTATFSNQSVTMSVDAGQYLVRQSRIFCPYFSGKPQLIEDTCFNFQNEAGVIKRIGYFSSNAVAPYDSDKDGIWIEADGTNRRIICSNSGTIVHNVQFESWDAYEEIKNYDWSKFTVNEIDFLWLGGAGLRLFLVVDGAFKLVHTIDDHAGYKSQLICKSPQQPVRYEIRSTSGSGSLTAVCSMVASEGAANESGEEVCVYTPAIAANVIGTIYALAGIRKTAANRDVFVEVSEFGATTLAGATSQNEAGVLLLMQNPTVSSALAWENNSRVQTAIATNQTISNGGRVVKAIPLSGGSQVSASAKAALRILTCGIDNTIGELILGYIPLTTNQSVSGYIQALEYS